MLRSDSLYNVKLFIREKVKYNNLCGLWKSLQTICVDERQIYQDIKLIRSPALKNQHLLVFAIFSSKSALRNAGESPDPGFSHFFE